MIKRNANTHMAQTGDGRFGDQMRETAHSLLHERKERVAMAVDGFADAFHHAAGALNRNGQYDAAHYARRAAGRIERISAGVRDYHLGDMAASAQRFANRRPVLYIAGAVALGFVLARLLDQSAASDSPRDLGAARERW